MNDAEAIGRRIKQLRAEAKLTQEAFARRLNVTRGAVGNWELGKGVKRENLTMIANELSTSFEWLATGSASPSSHPSQIQKVGYVGAGQAVFPFEADESEWVDAPPRVVHGTVAVEVRGDSMLPLYRDGALLYYSKQLAPDRLIGEQCIVRLEDERVLVKTLRRGAGPGLWTLVSLNAPDIEDVAVSWAAPIDWIKPR